MSAADIITTGRANSGTSAKAQANTRKRFVLVPLFLISVTIPYLFYAGPLQLSASRVILIAMLFPCLYMWITGRAGPILFTDIALILTCLWITLSYFALHGPDIAIEAGGITFIETMGAYFLGRCFIRTPDHFYKMVKVLAWLILLMLPFAIHEALTSKNILLDIANKIAPSNDIVFKEPRFGLDRVQGVFSHPILFGIFCGGTPALVYFVLGYKQSFFARWSKTGLVSFAAFLSLSSGPLTALIAQFMLLAWDRILKSIKRRWVILSSGVLSMVVALEIAANRSTPELFISYFAFNTHTASNRLRIWKYGTLSVENNPMFGVGRNEWERPFYMSPSIDMFWLVPAVRNGLPAALFLHAAFLALFFMIAFKSGLSERSSRYRTGFLICMMGFYLSGWTVDYWREIYVYFLFLLGSGTWFLTADKMPGYTPVKGTVDADKQDGGISAERTRGHVYTRFPHRKDTQD